MGIRFTCGECGHELHVKSQLAGKRGICPKCQAKIDIPAETADAAAGQPARHMSPPSMFAAAASVSAVAQPASVGPVAATAARLPAAVPVAALAEPRIDPIAENPQLLWYVVPPSATTPYGPAAGAIFRTWIEQGRVTPDSLVWRQDWPDWQPAGEVLPQFQAGSLAVSSPVALPGSGSSGSLTPPAGIPAGSATSMPGAWAAPGAPQASALVEHRATSLTAERKFWANVTIALLFVAILALLPIMFWVLKVDF